MGTVNTAIAVRELSFAYGKHEVLQHCNVSFDAGRFSVILGRNGCGKSTMLRIMAGLKQLQKGEIEVFGKPLDQLKPSERAGHIGFLAQQHRAVFPFSVAEVVLTGRAGFVRFSPGKRDTVIAGEAMERAGISHLSHRHYTELSGGEQQLVMIARLLAQQPDILLLDEPSTHLDLSNQAVLMKLLKDLSGQGITVIAVLHDPNLAFMYGDSFVFMHDKKTIIPTGSAAPWDQKFLEDIYGQALETIPFKNRAVVLPAISKK